MFYRKPETQELRKDLCVITFAVAQLVEAPRYKPEGRGSMTCVRTMALASAQSLTELSTRGISWRLKATGS